MESPEIAIINAAIAEHASAKQRSAERESVETDSRYWDCECKTNYIRPKTELDCWVCGAFSEMQPDSRASEVRAMLKAKGEVSA